MSRSLALFGCALRATFFGPFQNGRSQIFGPLYSFTIVVVNAAVAVMTVGRPWPSSLPLPIAALATTAAGEA